MKSLVAALSLSTALAIGTTSCAHQHLAAKQHAKNAAIGAAVIATFMLVALTVPCESCNSTTLSSSALPPR